WWQGPRRSLSSMVPCVNDAEGRTCFRSSYVASFGRPRGGLLRWRRGLFEALQSLEAADVGVEARDDVLFVFEEALEGPLVALDRRARVRNVGGQRRVDHLRVRIFAVRPIMRRRLLEPFQPPLQVADVELGDPRL